ncbi:LOW QUALITY PROTEIN: hypothetical protein CVT26_007638 [Gymnopilus dilepis]|uniref:DUF6533 domain-containing protein n=1 Tax=Gymnopilus dilepis TaxID=231916 RepID=A0A409VZP5_9AGAR|nr:LOW QUALITY PROTEIN: hypothetical protein CVT26_007638 [Gymnopilus dilepis]
MSTESLSGAYNPEWSDARNYLSLAALVLLTLDTLSSCKLEYVYVWGARLSWIKAIYMWARYAVLAALVVHYTLVHVFLARGPVSPGRCRAWFLFLASLSTTLQICFDGLLLIRVWALYKQRKIVIALAIPVVLQFVTAYILIGRNALKDEDFNEKCDLRRTPIESAPLGAVVFLTHFALWLTTYMKRNMAQETRNAAVMDYLVVTGNWSFSVLGVIAVGTIAYPFAIRTVNPVIIFVWPSVLISMTVRRSRANRDELEADCIDILSHMVINMRRLKSEPSPIGTDDFVLTTVISMSLE